MKKTIRLLGLLFVVFGMLSIGQAKAGFRVGILGDRTGSADARVFQGIVDEMEVLHPDFVINVGDLIEGPQPDEASINREWDQVFETLCRLTVPFYPIPGNNDIFDDKSQALYVERTGRKTYYSFDVETAHFIMLDVSRAESAEQVDADQIAWLEADLKANYQNRLIFVALHKPFWIESFRRGTSDALHDLFVRYQVDWVFTGHYHTFASELRDGVQYIMIGSSGGHCDQEMDASSFYQYGWLTVDDFHVDFGLLKSGSLMARDHLTLDKILLQDKINSEYIRWHPVLIPIPYLPSENEFKIVFKNCLNREMAGGYSWNLEETPWVINPVSGRYALSGEKTNAAFSAQLQSSTIYPLPEITVEAPLPDGSIYHAKQRLRVTHDLRLKMRKKTPVVDGLLREDYWKKSVVLRDFGNLEGDISSIEPTEVRLGASDKDLYLSVKALESQPGRPEIPSIQRDGPVFEHDCIYLFFWTPQPDSQIVHFIINPNGDVMDRKGKTPEELDGRPQFDASWNSAIQVAKGRTSVGWNLEVQIPLKEIGFDPGSKNHQIRFNIVRYQERVGDVCTFHWPIAYSLDGGSLITFK